MKRLAIISHTEHYKNTDGNLVGFASTIKEINYLADIFDHIYHIAMFHDTKAPKNTLPYESNNIEFVEIPNVGGKTMSSKLKIVFQAPKTLSIISKVLKRSDYYQFRAPTGIGVYVIPYLLLNKSKKGWFKFGGNWEQKHAPVTYKFQKWLLSRQSKKVTINGKWENQPNNCLSFENPCLTNKEISDGKNLLKSISNNLELCFVGRLEEKKGLDILLNSLSSLSLEQKSKIKTLHIAGEGKTKKNYILKSESLSIPIVFHGLLSRQEVHEIYKKSNYIILPSSSEGFPKVISEAMNYGCIPIVSNVSSISQYVKDFYNGFLIESLSIEVTQKKIGEAINLVPETYLKMSNNAKRNIVVFSYKYYCDRIENELLT